MKALNPHLTLITATLTLLFFAGCGKSPSGTYPSGTYVTQQHPGHYLELRKDGTFFLREDTDMSGTYRVEGQKIKYTFARPGGYTTSDRIDCVFRS